MEENRKIGISLVKLIFIVILIILIIGGLAFWQYQNSVRKEAEENLNKQFTEGTKNIEDAANKKVAELKTYKFTFENENKDEVIKKLNDDFTIRFKKVGEETIEDVQNYQWDVSVNSGKAFYSEEGVLFGYLFDQEDGKYFEFTVYTYGDYLFYVNHDFTDIRNEELFVVNKKGDLVKKIYEFDENNKGLVLNEFSFKDGALLVEASRLTHGPSIVAENYFSMIELNTEELFNLPKNLVVMQTYKYTFYKNGTADFNNPQIVKTTTLIEYLQENKDDIGYAKENIEKYINGVSKETSNNTSKQEQLNNEIFNAVTKNGALLQKMAKIKNFDIPEFDEDEAIKLLPLLDDSNYFKYDEDVARTTTENAKKLVKKYFGIDLQTLRFVEVVDAKTYDDADIYLSADTGYGIVKFELNSIKAVGTDRYAVGIKYKDGDGKELGNYILTVDYKDGNIIYKSFEKE